MYSVMIADKRKSMIQVYRNMMPWEKYGFEITSVTSQEQQAISYYGEYKHDLVIVDIELAKGNGLSLIHKLKTLHQDCMIVVISNKSDHASIRQAFRYGVLDYQLKSDIKFNDMIAILQEVKKQLQQKEPLEKSWEKQMEELLGHIRDGQMIDQEDLLSLIDREEMHLIYQPYRMIMFRLDNVRQINKKLKDYDQPDWLSSEEFLLLYANRLEQREHMKVKLEEIIHQMMKNTEYQLLFIKKHSGLIIVKEQQKQDLLRLCHDLQFQFNETLKYEFSFILSEKQESLSSFLPGFHSVINGIDQKFYIGDNTIIDLEKTQLFTSLDKKSIGFHQKIIKHIQIYDESEMMKEKDALLAYMNQHQIEPDDVRNYLVEIIDSIEKLIKTKELLDGNVLHLQKEAILECESFQFLIYEADRIFKVLRDQLQKKYSKKHSMALCMMEYMDAHLQEDITASDVAKEINRTLMHASRLLKEEFQVTIIQALNEKRIKRAREFLLTTNWKIKEIAATVGIHDQLYFNKLFHKYYGCSPSEFRHQKHM